jgi:hypothetical protein
MPEKEWGLVYLCWTIAVGSFVATGFTLRRFFELRRERPGAQVVSVRDPARGRGRTRRRTGDTDLGLRWLRRLLKEPARLLVTLLKPVTSLVRFLHRP